MSADELTLYSYRRCPFAMRVRMTLHEKGVPFTTVEEDLKNFSDQLRQYHPEAKVPVLKHGSRIVYESAVMTEYIDETFAGRALMPADPGLRAEVRLWTYWANHIFKMDIDHYKYGESRFAVEQLEGTEDRLRVHLAKLEERLAQQSWLVGEDLTLADIHVFPFVRQLYRATPAYDGFDSVPMTVRWYETMAARPSFGETMEKKR